VILDIINKIMEEYQKELFHNVYSDKKLKKKRFKKPLFVKSNVKINLSYEQLSLFTILFVLLLSVIFTLGVERGKNISFKSNTAKVSVLDKKKTPEVKVEPISKEEKKEPLASKEVPSEYFTIQVVTYKKDSLVKSELKYLEKKGYEAFVVTSGRNNKHICVGKFNSKNNPDIKKALMQLRKRYKDCFIKRVKREVS